MTSDDDAGTVDELLATAYALDGPDDSRALYARWAETYESGFIAKSRYVYHEHVATTFASCGLDQLAPTDLIIDVGCGTGLAGEALRRHCDLGIDGLDISPEMLREAARKQYGGAPIYRMLIEGDLSGPLTIVSDTYAGAISVGTFTHGHVGPDALSEVVRIVRPGGRAAIGINAAHFSAAGFGPALDQLVQSGWIDDLRLVDVPVYEGTDMVDPNEVGRIALFGIA